MKSRQWYLNKQCVLFFLLFAMPSMHSFSQQVSASLDREKILLGEQVTLQLKLQDFNPRTSFIAAWFHLADTANHIEVIKREAIDTVDVGGLSTYLQKITITSFDSGRWQVSPLILTIQDKATAKQTQLKANDIFIEVLPVDVTGLTRYHELKDIIGVNVQNNVWILSAIALLTVCSFIALILLMNMKQKMRPDIARLVVKGTALERALTALQALQNEELIVKRQVKMFYTRLDNICRTCLEEQFRAPALQSTSDELMVLLSVYLQNEKMHSQFYQFLRLADAVKFAKYIPQEAQHTEALHTAGVFLQYFDEIMKQTKYNADRVV